MSLNIRPKRSHLMAAGHYNAANFSLGEPSLFDHGELNDLQALQDKCRALPVDPAPGLRRRAKSECIISPDGAITPLLGRPYKQDYEGAELGVRQFVEIDMEVVALRSYQELLRQHRVLARLCQPELFGEDVREIVHLVNYGPRGLRCSFSHPIENHSDKEKHVGLTVVEVSNNLIGGGNNLFVPGAKLPNTHIRLNVLESLILGDRCKHGVSVMSSSDGELASRSIALFTYQRATAPPDPEGNTDAEENRTAG